MERVVTTLPTTIRTEMSNARIQGIIAGGLLAHHIGADFTPWMGLNGRASDISPEAQHSFNAIAQTYGPQKSTHVMSDTNPTFVRFVQESTETLIENGHLVTGEIEQLVCECGIVHIEKSAVEETRIDKLQNIKQRLGALVCKHCEGALMSESSEHIATTPSLYRSLDTGVDLFPQRSVHAKVNSIIEETSQKRKIISRTNRSKGIEFQTNGSAFILDPDFSLQFAPSYLPGNSETILISGSRQIERVVGSMAIFKTLATQSTPISLLHPRVVLHPNNPSLGLPASTNPHEALQSTLLTASTLSWNNHESKLSEGDFIMLTKMSSQLSAVQTEQGSTAEKIPVRPSQENSVASFMQLYSPQRIRAVLKAIRRGNILNGSDEATLLSDLHKW